MEEDEREERKGRTSKRGREERGKEGSREEIRTRPLWLGS